MNWMDRGSVKDKTRKLLRYLIDTNGDCTFNQCVMCEFFKCSDSSGQKKCELSPNNNNLERVENAKKFLGVI